MVLDGERGTTEGTAVNSSYVVDDSLGLVGDVHVPVVRRKRQASGFSAVESTFVLSDCVELTRRVLGMNTSLVANIYT